jgi:hypothetical protein
MILYFLINRLYIVLIILVSEWYAYFNKFRLVIYKTFSRRWPKTLECVLTPELACSVYKQTGSFLEVDGV